MEIHVKSAPNKMQMSEYINNVKFIASMSITLNILKIIKIH